MWVQSLEGCGAAAAAAFLSCKAVRPGTCCLSALARPHFCSPSSHHPWTSPPPPPLTGSPDNTYFFDKRDEPHDDEAPKEAGASLRQVRGGLADDAGLAGRMAAAKSLREGRSQQEGLHVLSVA